MTLLANFAIGIHCWLICSLLIRRTRSPSARCLSCPAVWGYSVKDKTLCICWCGSQQLISPAYQDPSEKGLSALTSSISAVLHSLVPSAKLLRVSYSLQSPRSFIQTLSWTGSSNNPREKTSVNDHEADFVALISTLESQQPDHFFTHAVFHLSKQNLSNLLEGQYGPPCLQLNSR